tara:strand:+ start:2966 stop:3148 length:183 start_codon:yes stop_codon:yes gene_type:complete
MKVGELVKIIGYAADLLDVGLVIDYRPAEKNGVRVTYYNVLMPDRSTMWLSPDCLEFIEK